MSVGPKEIGAWLKRLRERDGRYTQEQLAPLVGTTTRTVGAWERGETTPDADQLFALCALYGLKTIRLDEVGGADPQQAVPQVGPPTERPVPWPADVQGKPPSTAGEAKRRRRA